MSILTTLYKQSLIHQRNNAELQMIRNNAARMNFLGIHQGRTDFSDTTDFENSLDLDNINLSTELAAVNTELNSINKVGSSLNYLA